MERNQFPLMKTIVIQPSYPLETCNLRHTAVLSIGDLQSLSYSRLIHWRFAIFVFILTFVGPPVAKELHWVLCFIFGVDQFHRKFFCVFSISSTICFGTRDLRHKCIILDKANVLKTIVLPSKVKFLMH